MPAQTDANIMDLLKASTAEHHARAEHSPLQQRLVRGSVTRDEYADWLAQMLLVHRALESEIERARPLVPALRHIGPLHAHAHRLEADLAALRPGAPAPRPLAPTQELSTAIAAAARREPAALVGFHYVLEGSMNGNRYIAVAVRKGLGLAPGHADRYLDPHADQQRAVWSTFRAAMGGEPFTPDQTAEIIAAAARMFDGVADVSNAVAA
jgi:heme oxygenase